MDAIIRSVCDAFRLQGTYLGYIELKNGNINRTFRVDFRTVEGVQKSYILQRVNTYVFKKPREVMSNIDRVTSYLRKKDPAAVSLHFHHIGNGQNYLEDGENGFWRLFTYVPSVTYNTCDNMKVVRGAGEAFGRFQTLLDDFPAEELYETIPDFHNTAARYDRLMETVQADPCGKVKEVPEELAWLAEAREQACRLTTMQQEGRLPLRVTHNDTKINNVLFDEKTGAPLVVIDLDTVMPGLVGHDFGDAIRFAANYTEEDARDWEKSGLRLDVFEAFADGFLAQTAKALTQEEIDTLALSAFVMTTELVVRFLDDYLQGSPYFKCLYPEHNLVRTRCQMALAKDMLKHMDEMQEIVTRCAAKYRL